MAKANKGPVSNIVEIWFSYFIGLLAIAARVYCRTRLVGLKGYQLDDYLVIAVACLWTAVPVIGHISVVACQGRHTSKLTHEDRENMPPEEYGEWEHGSQIFMLGISIYFLVLWMLKFNMLCFYKRVVKGLWVEKFVKPVMGLVLCSAAIVALTLALYCRPFHALWQVWPDPGPRCVPQNIVFFSVILAFNLLTDTCIMLIPSPVGVLFSLVGTHSVSLTVRKVIIGIQRSALHKAGLILLFSLGFFCMSIAILRFILVFHMDDVGISAMWSMREDFVGVMVGQLPLITPMLRRRFWARTGHRSTSRGPYGHFNDRESHGRGLDLGPHMLSGNKKTGDRYSLPQFGIARVRSDSEEEIVYTEDKPTTAKQYDLSKMSGIMVERTVEVERSSHTSIEGTSDTRMRTWVNVV